MNTNELSKARSRILGLVDEGSFAEIGALVKARATDFQPAPKAVPGDGVITGYATVNGRLCYVYSQDAGVLGGSMGEMHAKKIVSLYEMAVRMGAPVIGLVDSAGMRLEEATDALNAFGLLHLAEVRASGIVPQILAIFGKCGGGMAISAGLADFVYMEEKKAELFVSAPNTLDGNYTEKCNTASAEYQSEHTGLVDGIGSEEEVLREVRELVGILPANNSDLAVRDAEDDLNRLTEELENVTDADEIVRAVADSGIVVEVKKHFGKEMLTAFIRMDGITVGVVGNREHELTPDGCEKAASFVNFCDAFEIPVLSLTGVRGFRATVEAESRMALAASRLTYAFANATVPKISVIPEEAMGSAYVIMNSKALGADIVYALQDAKIGVMDAGMAAKILAKDPKDIPETAVRFDEKQTAEAAAARGLVDEIVTMTTLRKNLLLALEMLFNKSGDQPVKKHGTK